MKPVYYSLIVLVVSILPTPGARAQTTYVNPVIPGDHPDPTLTRIGDNYYSSGSSFNVTPKIYHSTDLVHWKVIAQPVAASWSQYGDQPAGGVWGGHMVYHGDQYWHFFGRGTGDRAMYFVTADQPEGPWGAPVRMTVPPSVTGFGVDNSIFIDDDDRWFLLTKNGRSGNYIVELGDNGQASGAVYDLTWLNPSGEGYPYSWAEGPVMWKRDGFYYYSFAQHLAGNQFVMKSAEQGAALSDEPAAWEVPRILFEGRQGAFRTPNHSSPAVTTPDGTSWIISQSYDVAEWQALGRQGLLSQIVYDADGWPTAEYPNGTEDAPELPSSGIPWTVPRSDTFNDTTMAPHWSFLGYTPDNTHSLTDRPGWLRLTPYGGNRLFPGQNTVIQNASEHAFNLLTRIDFSPAGNEDEAGLWTFNGPEALEARLSLTADGSDGRVVRFSFEETVYTDTIAAEGAVWLRLERAGHELAGFFSLHDVAWDTLVDTIDVSRMDREQPSSESGYDFNAFTGNQQGLYVRGDVPAYFDFYVYRDAYSPIPAQHPSNYNGVTPSSAGYLSGVSDGDWAMFAGVDFGGGQVDGKEDDDYPSAPQTVEVLASSAANGGILEVRLDSIDGQKIAEVAIDTTGSWGSYKMFTGDVAAVGGQHDVFLVAVGSGSGQFCRIARFHFNAHVNTAADHEIIPSTATLSQNYPNPFGIGGTSIGYSLQTSEHVRLSVFNLLGQRVATLVDGLSSPGDHRVTFDGHDLPNGIYFYRLRTGNQTTVKVMTLAR